MIDFTLPKELVELRERVDDFIREQVIPFEDDPRYDAYGPTDELRLVLVEKARAAGLLSPHAPQAMGGLGLDHRGMAVIFEAAGYSTLGALALNIQAPDEGNTNLLWQVATPEQQEAWLRPMVSGRVRSVFAMTEPDNGAGSDPSLLKTVARQEGQEWVISGRKTLISGLPGAGFIIVMARAIDVQGHDLGATMFICDAQAPGVNIVRMLKTIDSNTPGGHCVVDFDGVRAGPDRILGEVGKGFRYAQVRLAPARLTHCMRWLGQAKRCQDIALDYARERIAFGKHIWEHEGIGFMLADNDQDLHLSRLAIWHAAWTLDQHQEARLETSQVKVFCSEALGRVVDRCVQILGGKGITADTVIERVYRDIRPFRIYDGPSEVHRWSIARTLATRR